ncbi:hypothetical protein SAMN04487779_10532 [Belnapia rosea]|uniref:Uncharacterized protein n=1 Tax=Belnapia rosea TaxID=938405 RepID=A0A1G7DUS9_9PROT|nr:hypothetical protein SAMN04487779_10532 [Belnapia rosea]
MLDPGVQQLDRRAQLADALHGGGGLAVGRISLAAQQPQQDLPLATNARTRAKDERV